MLGLALVSFPSVPSYAQSLEAEHVDANFEGKVGGGLLGAELGLVAVGAFGVKETWPYLVGAAVGGAGGVVAGHFLIDQNDAVTAGVAVMATGIAFAIPALVFAVSRSQYDPEDDADVVVSSHESKRVRVARRSAHQAHARSGAAVLGGSLVRYDADGLTLGAPALSCVPMFSRQEQLRYGIKQQTELRVALLSGSF